MTKQLFRLALLIAVIASTGTLIWDFALSTEHDTVLGLTTFIIGTVTFFGIMMISQQSGEKLKVAKGELRTAVTASIVITYLFLLSFSVFLGTPDTLDPITKTFIDSFTGLVGVTIAFYFGASATLQALGKEDTKEKEKAAESEANITKGA